MNSGIKQHSSNSGLAALQGISVSFWQNFENNTSKISIKFPHLFPQPNRFVRAWWVGSLVASESEQPRSYAISEYVLHGAKGTACERVLTEPNAPIIAVPFASLDSETCTICTVSQH